MPRDLQNLNDAGSSQYWPVVSLSQLLRTLWCNHPQLMEVFA